MSQDDMTTDKALEIVKETNEKLNNTLNCLHDLANKLTTQIETNNSQQDTITALSVSIMYMLIKQGQTSLEISFADLVKLSNDGYVLDILQDVHADTMKFTVTNEVLNDEAQRTRSDAGPNREQFDFSPDESERTQSHPGAGSQGQRV